MNLGSIDSRDLRPTRDIVFEILRKAILDGSIAPGERIMETTVAEMLNISRTPVREAFRKLEIEGLTEYHPKKGTVVRGITKEDIAEIYDMREVLEGLAVRIACQNADENAIARLRGVLKQMEASIAEKDDVRLFELHDEYNNIILQMTDSKRLINNLGYLYEYITSFRKITLSHKERKAISLKEHIQIVDYIEQRDGEKAEKYCRDHIKRAKEIILLDLS